MAPYFNDSPELRSHIRNLLYDYSKLHCTTNYLTFTEDLVSEFIEDLKPVPLTDAYSLVRPVDPFDTFSQLHGIGLLEPYDEIPQTTHDARLYLKNVMGSTRGKPKSERVVWNDDYDLDSPYEPFLPALTRRARQSTPKLGTKPKAPAPASYHNLLKSQKIDTLLVEPIEEEKLIPEEVLQANLQIDSTDLPNVRALLQKTTDMRRLHKSHKNKYLDPDFLRNDVSPTIEWPEELFTPIFPRSRLPRSGVAPSTQANAVGCKSFVDIPSTVMNKIEVEDPDGDLSRQNLVIVDGWETIRSSPPSSQSSKHTDEDQVDELFLFSSPDTEPSHLEEPVHMEEIVMPRSRKIGGSSGITPHILAGKTLGSFLAPLLPPPNPNSWGFAEEPTLNEINMRSSPTPSSLFGQPPSVVELNMINNDSNIQDQDLDVELKRLYNGHGLNNLIMNEAIDDKQDMLMEVPALPAPNVHKPNEMHVAKSFRELVVLVNSFKNAKGGPPPVIHRCLKKVKGCQSLGIALSWIPFTVDKKLPTVDELIGVNDLLFDDKSHTAEQEESVKVETLLKSLDLGNADVQVSLTADSARFASFDNSRICRLSEAFDDFHIVINRQERRRLATLEGRIADQGIDDTEGAEVGEAQVQDCHRHQQQDHLRDDFQEGLEDERPHKRPRLESHSFEDRVTMVPQGGVNSTSRQSSMHDRHWPEANSPTVFVVDDDNKENWPPLSSSLSKLMDDTEDYQMSSDGFLGLSFEPDATPLAQMEEDQQESFEALSFGSRQPPSQAQTNFYQYDSHGLDTLPRGQDTFGVEYMPEDIPMDENEEPLPERGVDLALASEPDIASQALGIFAFAHLRARKVSEHLPAPVVEPIAVPVPTVTSNKNRSAPPELFDQNTLRLPDVVNPAQSIHRYMASLEFIQKHALVCALRSSECSVELVERQTLGGVDLIVDPHCAIIFLSLFTLAARCDVYTERISKQSWKFSRLLVIFEAYPEQRSKRSFATKNRGSSRASSLELYAFTPPIVKAIKKFRRDVNIADACGTKCSNTKVQYAFANTVDEAALLTRWFGEMAEEVDETGGAVWGEREWLAVDFLEDEENCLAGICGMNNFSASIILCEMSLQEFVDMSPEDRMDGFGGYVGMGPMMNCNADLGARAQAMQSSTMGSVSELEGDIYREEEMV